MRNSGNQENSFHFIGIGGIGMSALALILVKKGYLVSGSDPKQNPSIEELSKHGVRIFKEQKRKNITRILQERNIAPRIVISTAIPKNNPELQEALDNNLEILHRSKILAHLVGEQPSIAVAGTHGKTTTSTFITTLLASTNQDPTVVIGGIVPCYESNAHFGKGRLLIAEADESDGTLVDVEPDLGLITNLELDHTDHYTNLEELIKTMTTFGEGCRKILANHDCPTLRKNLNATAWWSIQEYEGVDFAALPISLTGKETIADIYEQGLLINRISFPTPGLHNLSNAIAAIGACRLEGQEMNKLLEAVQNLEPPKRRFDLRGIWQERYIVDDYAHHPSEVSSTIAMSRLMINNSESRLPSPPKRLTVVFQPHRYSRTHQFLMDFANALSHADSILLAPVYSAGESIIKGASSKDLEIAIKKIKPDIPIHTAKDLEDLTALVNKQTYKGDLVLAMGAGNINSLWDRLKAKEQNNKCLSTAA